MINNYTTPAKLLDGSFDLQKEFIYRGITFTCDSYGKGSKSHSEHIVQGIINGKTRTFTSTTRKQAKDMFKKEVRKSQKTL